MSKTEFTAACVQMTSGADIRENLNRAGDLIRQAAGQGAEFIATPENSCHMQASADLRLEHSPLADEHPGPDYFAGLAAELGVWLLAGSIGIRLPGAGPEGGDMLANRSFLFDDQGRKVAAYDKIHLFDVALAGGESYRESRTTKPGDQAVVAPTPWGLMGMSICYDVRFAHLYRALAQAGAQFMTVPAAFTVATGQAHWQTLLQARAIETGSFMIAPAQTGTHPGGRKTWGHSLIVGPWGDILADAGAEEGIITARLNLDESAKARASIPSLQHDRLFHFIGGGQG